MKPISFLYPIFRPYKATRNKLEQDTITFIKQLKPCAYLEDWEKYLLLDGIQIKMSIFSTQTMKQVRKFISKSLNEF